MYKSEVWLASSLCYAWRQRTRCSASPGGNTLKTFLHKPLESSVFRGPPSSSSASPGLSGGATASGVTGTTSRPGACNCGLWMRPRRPHHRAPAPFMRNVCCFVIDLSLTPLFQEAVELLHAKFEKVGGGVTVLFVLKLRHASEARRAASRPPRRSRLSQAQTTPGRHGRLAGRLGPMAERTTSGGVIGRMVACATGSWGFHSRIEGCAEGLEAASCEAGVIASRSAKRSPYMGFRSSRRSLADMVDVRGGQCVRVAFGPGVVGGLLRRAALRESPDQAQLFAPHGKPSSLRCRVFGCCGVPIGRPGERTQVPSGVADAVGTLRSHGRFTDAFLMGAFATLLATSCSAPPLSVRGYLVKFVMSPACAECTTQWLRLPRASTRLSTLTQLSTSQQESNTRQLTRGCLGFRGPVDQRQRAFRPSAHRQVGPVVTCNSSPACF